MKRRAFVGSALSALTVSALPLRHLLAEAVMADVPAVTGAGKQIVLTGKDVGDLRASMRGDVLTAVDQGYEQARKVWNGAFDRKPALIARCTGAADVVSAVNFARAHDLLVSVRGGGHSLSGQSACDGGLMIDLATLRSVHVDPIAKRARVDGGVLLGQLDREAQAFGLATTAGTVSHTGAGGLTLGGGFGRIGRKFGLACDNLLAADLVPASGKFTHASADENPDLLWGLRGGGGNFGVVTSFEYQLHDVPTTMLGGPLIFPLESARDMWTFFSGFAPEMSDETYADTFLFTLPDGKRVCIFDTCYFGDFAAGEKAYAPLRQHRKPVQDLIAPTPYVRLQSSSDEVFAPGRRYYLKSGNVTRIEPGLIDLLVGAFESTQLPTVFVAFAHCGGAESRVPKTATAYWQREAQHNLIVGAGWENPADTDATMQWVRATWKQAEKFTSGFYINDLAHDDPAQRIRSNYGDNYDRLVALKTQYDPGNLFRLNANILPKPKA